MPSQASTTDQLAEAIGLCNHAGLYDAADWLRREVQKQRVYSADCIKCEADALAAAPDIMCPGGMILCVECGNKRCPKATDHRLDCTGSNEPNQPGSVFCYSGKTPRA